MVLVESCHNSEQVSLMRPIYTEKCIFGTKTRDLKNEGGLNFEWSLKQNITVPLTINLHKTIYKTSGKSQSLESNQTNIKR